MVRKYSLIVILLALSVSYAEDSKENDFEEITHEGSACDEKISTALSVMNTETTKKLDAMDKKIPEEEAITRKLKAIDKHILEKLDEATKTQLDILEKKLPERLETYIEKTFQMLERRYRAIQAEIQEDLYEKIHKLEKNLFDKLEEYVDEKINSLEKHIYRKINALERVLPQKIDTNIINYKLDALKKIQLDSDGSTLCALANKTYIQLEEQINKTLNVIEKIKLDLENTTTNFNFEKLDTSLTNLEDNLNQKLTEVMKIVPDIERSFKLREDGMDNNATEQLQKNINSKLDTIERNIDEINENIQHKIDTLDKAIEQNINEKLDQIQKDIPELQNNINIGMAALKDLEKDVLDEVHQTRYGLSCKELHVTGGRYLTPYFRMDDVTLNHVLYRNESAGLTFNMHLAVKGNDSAHILLSPDAAGNVDLNSDVAFEIEIRRNNTYVLKTRKRIVSADVPEILATTRFNAINVKIYNGKLEMIEEGSIAPFISYSDPDLNSVKYFSFGATKEDKATILYDCPSNLF